MKILIAVDGSKHSEWAVDTVSKLPLSQEAVIEVIQVVESQHLAPFYDPSLVEEFNNKLRNLEEENITQAKENVHELAASLRSYWKNSRSLIIKDANPADRILARAESESVDLIVVGSRGKSKVNQLLMGSVSTKIASHAPCSVLVVKNKVRTIEKILVAIDGSEYSRNSVEFFKTNFQPPEVEISFLYVWPYAFDPPKALLKSPSTAIEDVLAQELKQQGFTTKSLFAEGDPAQTIMAQATEDNAHLIVVGSRGLSGVKRFLLGSVSQKVIKYADQSVLIIK